MIITRIPDEAAAFSLENNTLPSEITEGKYLVRFQIDNKDEAKSAAEKLTNFAEGIKFSYPNTMYTFDIPGRPKGEIILTTSDGNYELRLYMEVNK